MSEFDSIERWLPIPNFPSHEVSDLGRVRRAVPHYNSPPNGIMKLSTVNGGYQRIYLKTAGNRLDILIHRLVLLAFVGPCPDGKEVNHKDGVKTNNRLSNLEYLTRSENMYHAYENKLRFAKPSKGTAHGRSILNDQEVLDIRASYAEGKSTQKQLAMRHGVCVMTICLIINRKTWTHI